MKNIFKLIITSIVTIIVAALVNKKTNGKASEVVNDGIDKTTGFFKKAAAKIFQHKEEDTSTVNLNENNGSEATE